jgi:hypothetical protein
LSDVDAGEKLVEFIILKLVVNSCELKSFGYEAFHFELSKVTIVINIKIIPNFVYHLLDRNFVCSQTTCTSLFQILVAGDERHGEPEPDINILFVSEIDLERVLETLEDRTE